MDRKLPMLPLCSRPLRWCLVAAWLSPGAAAAASHTGVCPDGSIYIVQDVRQIPCANAKPVASDEVPPIRPEYLPTPYTWKVWNERHSPHNPYNVIDAAREVRGLEAPPPAPAGGPVAAVPPTAAPPKLPQAPFQLGLAEDELRDLFQIVELSQERIPARIVRETANGEGVFEVSFARSAAFEGVLQEAFASRGGLPTGGVLLFSARSAQPEEFYASFTFLQQHLSYQPDATDPRQLGVLTGRLGALSGGEAMLGYISLPPNFDPAGELDIYWDDRRITVTFAQ